MNKIIIKGNITKDLELRQTPSGKHIVQFGVATQRRYDKDKTDFHTVIAWEGTADFVLKWFKKGSPILVIGVLQYRDYEDKNGVKRTVAEIKADEIEFAGPVDTKKPEKPKEEPPKVEPKFEPVNIDDSELPF